MFSSMRSKILAAGAAAVVIGGGSYGIAAATASSAATTATSSTPSAHASARPSGSATGGGSNARSGPAAGGTTGTVTSVTSSGFTVETWADEKATIKEQSSTTYEKGTSQATASAVTKGEPVLVLGTTDNTTITAAQVLVNPPGTSAWRPGGQVLPFNSGLHPTTQVGQIPSDYNQGSGTLVSGTAADKATEAALAAYPGGIVDRVVAIGGGVYEVHSIGDDWPHHIFVNSDFQVIGAND